MGTYGAPFATRGSNAVLTALSAAWNVVVVAAALRGGEGVFSAQSAVVSVTMFSCTTYVCLWRIAYRVTLRAGIVEWQAPARTETLWVADIVSIRVVRPLPYLVSIRRRRGPALLVMVGKGLPALAEAVRGQRPDLDVALGPWARVSDRMPGESWWRPGRHYRSAGPASPLAPWPGPGPGPVPVPGPTRSRPAAMVGGGEGAERLSG